MKRRAAKLVEILEEREQRKKTIETLKKTIKKVDVNQLRPEDKKMFAPLIDGKCLVKNFSLIIIFPWNIEFARLPIILILILNVVTMT